jgi:hypothetical protein
VCPDCGQPVSAYARFCSACAAQLPDVFESIP